MDNNDETTLPADTLAILNEFLAERSQREHAEEQRQINKTGKDAHFEEDWQLSQFWYSEQTKRTIGNAVEKILAEQSNDDFRIALLSCPSLYATIKNLHDKVNIFEYDQRFAAYGNDFVHYDFNAIDSSSEYLKDHHKCFDLIIADPPFLSEECMSKMSRIVISLQRSSKSKLVFCSGEVVEPWLVASLPVHRCRFRPEHERNLGNEFVSYANFNFDHYIDK
ncbi:protein-lysine N-methyltransferase CG9154 [Drosophila grimshawi]|uniref:Protein-lysine N-methyltransferase Dgri_GH10933 n=1 Tax=Drosophila grimshawi TaxID=7222 RepID=B4JB04_DROGR|nr:protein-lysine N-methyltransferase CG9154 [Drosophila grimshawi]EDW02874.1 GH10933 [Drosophila grimshawi]